MILMKPGRTRSRISITSKFGSEAFAYILEQLRKRWAEKKPKNYLWLAIKLISTTTDYIICIIHKLEKLSYQKTPSFMRQITVSITETEKLQWSWALGWRSRMVMITTSDRNEHENKNGHNRNNSFQRDQQSVQDKVRILGDRNTIKPPIRYETNIVKFDESSYTKVMSSKDAGSCKRAIDEELKAHELNGIWIYKNLNLKNLPEEKKPIRFKWVFKKKYI